MRKSFTCGHAPPCSTRYSLCKEYEQVALVLQAEAEIEIHKAAHITSAGDETSQARLDRARDMQRTARADRAEIDDKYSIR